MTPAGLYALLVYPIAVTRLNVSEQFTTVNESSTTVIRLCSTKTMSNIIYWEKVSIILKQGEMLPIVIVFVYTYTGMENPNNSNRVCVCIVQNSKEIYFREKAREFQLCRVYVY